MFDIFIFSALCLSVNVLVLCGLAYALFSAFNMDALVFSLAILGGAATGLLALTFKLVMHLVRAYLREKSS